MTGQKVQGAVLAAVVSAAAVACAGSSNAEGPQPTVVDSLPPPGANGDAASPSSDEGAESPGASSPDDTDFHDEDDGPEAEPTPIPASSDGPAQNWPAPEPPDEIYEPTEEGAEALIQYWFDVRHYARITGDTEPLEYVSLEGCVLCESHLERLAEVFSNDGWFVSDPDSVEDFQLHLESDAAASGILALSESDFETFWNSEFYSETAADSLDAFDFRLAYEDSRWQMAALNYQGEYESPQSREDSLIGDSARGASLGVAVLRNVAIWSGVPWE